MTILGYKLGFPELRSNVHLVGHIETWHVWEYRGTFLEMTTMEFPDGKAQLRIEREDGDFFQAEGMIHDNVFSIRLGSMMGANLLCIPMFLWERRSTIHKWSMYDVEEAKRAHKRLQAT